MKQPLRLGINGFGRIGRVATRIALDRKNIQIVAINSRADVTSHAYLLKHDSTYGMISHDIHHEEGMLIVDNQSIAVYQEADPSLITWSNTQVDIVIEATGAFTTVEKASAHLKGGAKKVIVTAPPKDTMPTYCMGVNHTIYDNSQSVVSNASCTTNCLATVAKALDDAFEIRRGFMTTTHAYTDSQNLLDNSHKKDMRLARSAPNNIIPTQTGASKALDMVLPQLSGKIMASSIRVPTATGSLIDLIVEISKSVSKEELNKAFEQVAEKDMKGILGVSYEPIVSSDIRGTNWSALVDASLTAAHGNLINVKAWYDNEWGYATRLIDLAEYIANA